MRAGRFFAFFLFLRTVDSSKLDSSKVSSLVWLRDDSTFSLAQLLLWTQFNPINFPRHRRTIVTVVYSHSAFIFFVQFSFYPILFLSLSFSLLGASYNLLSLITFLLSLILDLALLSSSMPLLLPYKRFLFRDFQWKRMESSSTECHGEWRREAGEVKENKKFRIADESCRVFFQSFFLCCWDIVEHRRCRTSANERGWSERMRKLK